MFSARSPNQIYKMPTLQERKHSKIYRNHPVVVSKINMNKFFTKNLVHNLLAIYPFLQDCLLNLFILFKLHKSLFWLLLMALCL